MGVKGKFGVSKHDVGVKIIIIRIIMQIWYNCG